MENLKTPVDSASQDEVALTFILYCSMLIPCQLSHLLILTVMLNLEMQSFFLHFTIKNEISGAFMANTRVYYSHLHCRCPYSTLNTIL